MRISSISRGQATDREVFFCVGVVMQPGYRPFSVVFVREDDRKRDEAMEEMMEIVASRSEPMSMVIENPVMRAPSGERPARAPGDRFSGRARRACGRLCLLLLPALGMTFEARGEEIVPSRIDTASGTAVGRFSDRTIVVALSIDRDAADLVAFTLKDRPFARLLQIPEARAPREFGGPVRIEVALLGPGTRRYTQRIDVQGLCLDHPAEEKAHVEGDTIRLHHETLTVEVPEIAGFDRIEAAWFNGIGGFSSRVVLGTMVLTADRFTAAGGSAAYSDLLIAAGAGSPAGTGEDPARAATARGAMAAGAMAAGAMPAAGAMAVGAGDGAGPQPGGSIQYSGSLPGLDSGLYGPTLSSGPVTAFGPRGSGFGPGSDSAPLTAASGDPSLTPGLVHWPEEYGDPDKYTVYGNAAELSSRINIVLVPDGYVYAEKATMQSHAQSLVNYFRTKTPYKEHDPFINYILVFAYSTESGTDQCDCSIVKDTAMRTRFPLINATCGHSDNRCLFYGTGNGGPNCDPTTGMANITASELRAPAKDVTIVMVNTTRYGGCGGSRAVYSAGNSSATEVAVHELGHTLAGLADEYFYTTGCGSTAGEVNTSTDAVNGAWPEWISTLGAPRQGAQYYTNCLYRPINNCVMQTLGVPFCPVCNQQWGLTFFGHTRVSPTAPISSSAPSSPVTTQVGHQNTFSATTRLATPNATNGFTWQLQGPGYPVPTTVSTSGSVHSRSFAAPGAYTLTLEVVADTNFIKKEKNGANVDQVSWTVDATAVPEVSDDPVHELSVVRNAADPSNVDIRFEDTGSDHYNLYVSRYPDSGPFRVASTADGKRACAVAAAPLGGGMLEISGYSLEAGITGDTSLLFLLVTADNGAGAEGSLGNNSASVARTADAYCNP